MVHELDRFTIGRKRSKIRSAVECSNGD